MKLEIEENLLNGAHILTQKTAFSCSKRQMIHSQYISGLIRYSTPYAHVYISIYPMQLSLRTFVEPYLFTSTKAKRKEEKSCEVCQTMWNNIVDLISMYSHFHFAFCLVFLFFSSTSLFILALFSFFSFLFFCMPSLIFFHNFSSAQGRNMG